MEQKEECGQAKEVSANHPLMLQRGFSKATFSRCGIGKISLNVQGALSPDKSRTLSRHLYLGPVASDFKIAVIGAGLAGIAAARRLTDRGAKVVVFEKSRGFGGRCASKRWEGQVMDHGAQYFTAREEKFRTAVRAASGNRLRIITAPILTGEGERTKNALRFYHVEGNSRIVRDLAQGLDVRIGCKVERVQRAESKWRLGGESFDAVLSTAPLPQTKALAGLDPGESDYVPCLALILIYEGKSEGPAHDVYAFSNPSDPVASWTACENHKEGRVETGKTALVVHASEVFSRAHLELNPEAWSAKLREFAENRWKIPSSAFLGQYSHRWRYARVAGALSRPQLPNGWYFAGDALIESRVESAWMAGWNAAEGIPLARQDPL